MAKKPAKEEAEGISATEAAVLRVTAAAGPRRRAGLSFGPTPTDLTPSDLGETKQQQSETVAILLADPMLSVSPIRDSSATSGDPDTNDD